MSNFIFRHSITTAWRHLIQDLLVHGTRLKDPERPSGDSREIIGHALTIHPGADWIVASKRRDPNWAWACMEVLWYLSLSDSVEPLLLLSPNYKRFLDEGSESDYGAYGRRLMHNPGHDMAVDGKHHQLMSVCKTLQKDPNSRQAVVSLWDSQDLAMHGRRKNIPCTLTLQFLVRDGKLDLICNMRSNDAWIGFIYDTFAYRVFQRLVANALGIAPGDYHHVVGSMHLYEKNAKAAEEAILENPDVLQFGIGHDWARQMDPAYAATILYKTPHSEYDLIDQLMDGAAKGDVIILREVAESARVSGTWFDHLIITAAEGCIDKVGEF